MNALRSVIYTVYFITWTIIFSLGFLPVLGIAKVVKNRKIVQRLAKIWVGGLMGGLRVIMGIRYEVRGRQYLPDGASIVAVKHQSAAETLLFHLILRDPIYVLKSELTAIPIVGWYLMGSGAVSVNRKAGAKAAKALARDTRARLAENGQIVIFPEGTRVPVGEKRPYQPGVVIVYGVSNVPIVPVALNTGACWPKNGFWKKPGTMVIEFLEPIEPGLNQKAALALLEERIEAASQKLLEENTRTKRRPGRPKTRSGRTEGHRAF